MSKKEFNRPNRSKAKTSHAGKNSAERTYYTKAIKEIRAEPTLDESLDFVESDNLESDFSVSETTKRRKIPVKMQLMEYVEKNWAILVPSFIVVVVTPWFFNSILDHRDRLNKVEFKIENVDKIASENKAELKEIDNILKEHALSLKELQIRNGIKNTKKVD